MRERLHRRRPARARTPSTDDALVPEIAKRLSDDGVRWCVVGDANYGEGSSREHAAMEPRYRGGLVVLARSFARIHETNLKKQGLLPLTFADPSTYDDDRRGRPDQRARPGVAGARRGPCGASSPSPTVRRVEFSCRHTFSDDQLGWFRAGSALNVIRNERRDDG